MLTRRFAPEAAWRDEFRTREEIEGYAGKDSNLVFTWVHISSITRSSSDLRQFNYYLRSHFQPPIAVSWAARVSAEDVQILNQTSRKRPSVFSDLLELWSYLFKCRVSGRQIWDVQVANALKTRSFTCSELYELGPVLIWGISGAMWSDNWTIESAPVSLISARFNNLVILLAIVVVYLHLLAEFLFESRRSKFSNDGCTVWIASSECIFSRPDHCT